VVVVSERYARLGGSTNFTAALVERRPENHSVLCDGSHEILREERHYQPGLQKLQQLPLLCFLEICR